MSALEINKGDSGKRTSRLVCILMRKTEKAKKNKKSSMCVLEIKFWIRNMDLHRWQKSGGTTIKQ
jgi:hypothetical protein